MPLWGLRRPELPGPAQVLVCDKPSQLPAGDKSAAEGKEGQHQVLGGAEVALLGWSSRDKQGWGGRGVGQVWDAETQGRAAGKRGGGRGEGWERKGECSILDGNNWKQITHYTTPLILITSLGYQRFHLCWVWAHLWLVWVSSGHPCLHTAVGFQPQGLPAHRVHQNQV